MNDQTPQNVSQLTEEQKLKLAEEAFARFEGVVKHLSAERQNMFINKMKALEQAQIQQLRTNIGLPAEEEQAKD